MPHSPCWANLYLDGAIGNRFWPDVMVVSRWPCRIESGRSLSYHLSIVRLVVVHVHLRRTAHHVQIDHLLGLGGEMKRASQWRGGRWVSVKLRLRPRRPGWRGQAFPSQKRRQRGPAHGVGTAAQELAARLAADVFVNGCMGTSSRGVGAVVRVSTIDRIGAIRMRACCLLPTCSKTRPDSSAHWPAWSRRPGLPDRGTDRLSTRRRTSNWAASSGCD